MGIFADSIIKLSRDYIQDYKDDPEASFNQLCKFYGPKRILYSLYLMLLREKEIEPIENYADKVNLWNEVKKRGGDKFSAIALYTLQNI